MAPEPSADAHAAGPTAESKLRALPAGADRAHPIPVRIRKLRAQWLALHRTWWTIHYLVGLAGVVAGVVAGALGSGDRATEATLLPGGWAAGVVAATATSIVTFLGPHQKAQIYWRAYHAVDQACLLFENDVIGLAAFGERVQVARRMVTLGLSEPPPDEPARTEG